MLVTHHTALPSQHSTAMLTAILRLGPKFCVWSCRCIKCLPWPIAVGLDWIFFSPHFFSSVCISNLCMLPPDDQLCSLGMIGWAGALGACRDCQIAALRAVHDKSHSTQTDYFFPCCCCNVLACRILAQLATVLWLAKPISAQTTICLWLTNKIQHESELIGHNILTT